MLLHAAGTLLLYDTAFCSIGLTFKQTNKQTKNNKNDTFKTMLCLKYI